MYVFRMWVRFELDRREEADQEAKLRKPGDDVISSMWPFCARIAQQVKLSEKDQLPQICDTVQVPKTDEIPGLADSSQNLVGDEEEENVIPDASPLSKSGNTRPALWFIIKFPND